MEIEIRLFEAARDAERVAAFYNENRYGPMGSNVPLTEQALLNTIRERDVRLLLVAIQEGRVVGTLGYARMSGRRVAEPDQYFAVMFLVAPTLRSGFLVGRLFADSFQRFAQLGARTLRVEVDPANRRAFPLYIRIGFRMVGHERPDEDGYVELVNHLPGVANDLIRQRFDDISGRSAPDQTYSSQTIKNARRQTLTSGVRRSPTGNVTVDYELDFASEAIVATVGASSGQIMKATIDGRVDARVKVTQGHSRELPKSVISRNVGEFTVSLDQNDGAIRISHPRHLGWIAVDPFPLPDSIPAGVRRPAISHVTTSLEATQWKSSDGVITRVVDFAHEAVSIKVETSGAEAISVFPWSGFRAAAFALEAEDVRRSEHIVRGIWPPDLTDFEPAVGSDFTFQAGGTCARWYDPNTGIELEIQGRSEGSWRVEGPHLARISSAGTILYSYQLREGSTPETAVEGTDLEVTDLDMGWGRVATEGKEVLQISNEESTSRITVSPSAGLVDWQCQGDVLLSSSYPSTRRFGPLDEVSSALWVALQNDRTDPDQGAEWALHDSSLPFGRPSDGWRVRASADLSVMDVEVEARRALSGRQETAVYLAPPGQPAFVDVCVPGEGWNRITCEGVVWRTWARGCRIPVANGFIEVMPKVASHPEILIRSTASGVLATMFSRNDQKNLEPTRWRLMYRSAE